MNAGRVYGGGAVLERTSTSVGCLKQYGPAAYMFIRVGLGVSRRSTSSSIICLNESSSSERADEFDDELRLETECSRDDGERLREGGLCVRDRAGILR